MIIIRQQNAIITRYIGYKINGTIHSREIKTLHFCNENGLLLKVLDRDDEPSWIQETLMNLTNIVENNDHLKSTSL